MRSFISVLLTLSQKTHVQQDPSPPVPEVSRSGLFEGAVSSDCDFPGKGLPTKSGIE